MFSIFAKSWTWLSDFTFTFHFHNKISKTHFVEVYAGGSVVKNPLAKQEMWIWSLGWEDSLVGKMATHPSILAWGNLMDRGAWLGYRPWGFRKVRHDLATKSSPPTTRRCICKNVLTVLWDLRKGMGGEGLPSSSKCDPQKPSVLCEPLGNCESAGGDRGISGEGMGAAGDMFRSAFRWHLLSCGPSCGWQCCQAKGSGCRQSAGIYCPLSPHQQPLRGSGRWAQVAEGCKPQA